MKKIIDFFIIVIVCGICLTGCGKGKKVNDKQDFKVDGISEIHVSLESWELKVDLCQRIIRFFVMEQKLY